MEGGLLHQNVSFDFPSTESEWMRTRAIRHLALERMIGLVNGALGEVHSGAIPRADYFPLILG
jgi:hypothetical protein